MTGTHRADRLSSVRNFVPDAATRKDIDLMANSAGFIAAASVGSVVVAWLLGLHPLSGGLGYFFAIPAVIGVIGALRRDVYRDAREANQAAALSAAAAGIAAVVVFVVWVVLTFQYAIS